jgi:hypothetical protein
VLLLLLLPGWPNLSTERLDNKQPVVTSKHMPSTSRREDLAPDKPSAAAAVCQPDFEPCMLPNAPVLLWWGKLLREP